MCQNGRIATRSYWRRFLDTRNTPNAAKHLIKPKIIPNQYSGITKKAGPLHQYQARAIKVEGAVEDYTKRNAKIAEKLGIREYAGLRVKKGVWRFIRFRYLFPLFYLVMTSAMFYFLIWIVDP